MQFVATKEVEENEQTIVRYYEVAAVSPNRNPSWNNRQQNVSFDRGTPGPGWRFSRDFRALFTFRLLHNAHL